MLQSLDIVCIQISTQFKNKRVRRAKQIIEIVDIDPTTKEILTNEVFKWNSMDDRFIYSGKSYILERIRTQYDMTKEDMVQEIKRRVEILEWMRKNNVRLFKEVARIISCYSETPNELMEKIRKNEPIENVEIPTENELKTKSINNDEKIKEIKKTKEKPIEKKSDKNLEQKATTSFFFKNKKKKKLRRGKNNSK